VITPVTTCCNYAWGAEIRKCGVKKTFLKKTFSICDLFVKRVGFRLGAFGMLRFAMPLTPDALLE
jgi:hypothetical protein